MQLLRTTYISPLSSTSIAARLQCQRQQHQRQQHQQLLSVMKEGALPVARRRRVAAGWLVRPF